MLLLYGPEDEVTGERGRSIAENDDAFLSGTCFLDSRIASFRLPVTGEYLILATSFQQEGGGANGHYRLNLQCNNGVCRDPEFPTFASSRNLPARNPTSIWATTKPRRPDHQ